MVNAGSKAPPAPRPQAFQCAVAARERSDPLAGSAPQARGWLLLEHPGPWPIDAVAGSGIEPTMLADLTGRAAESATRILLVRRPGRQAGATDRRWTLLGWGGRARAGVWRDDSDLSAAVAALDGDQSAACDLDPVIVVCAHGVHDTCCAIRGRPVAAALGQRWPDQVWECSHLGGDRFAPNVAILPDGFYYGDLDPTTAVETVERHLAGEVSAAYLRGMSRFAPPVQAAAAAVFNRYGPLAADDVTLRSVNQVGPHHGHGSKTFAELELHDGRRLSLEIESVRRPPAQLTCRAASATPATEYRIVSLSARAPHG